MSKTRPLSIVVLLSSVVGAYAEAPTISNISVSTDTNTAVVRYVSSTASPYCWVQYGIATGTYLWSSVSIPAGGLFLPNVCSVPINGLKSGTTYFFLPTARPNPDDETDICSVSGCGAVEQSATTPAASVSTLPAAPASVQANLLSEPDTSGYAIVLLADGGTAVNHECVASSTVSAPSGYSWTITSGQTLTQIIGSGNMTFGTVFEVPQGLTCIVPASDSRGHGYLLPQLAVDPLATGGLITAANHRWLIFRTAPGGAADFPPFNTRTGPSFFSHYGGFKGITPNTSGSFDNGGIIFTAPGSGVKPVHHVWIENLEFQADETQLANFEPFIAYALGQSGQAAPYPQYMVLRGNYFHFPNRTKIQSGVPSVQGAIIGTATSQLAFVGNYMDNMYFASPGIPVGIYVGDCGFTSSCSPASSVLIDNNYMMGMGMDIYVEVNNHVNPSPADYTITHNTLYWPYSTTYPYAVSIGGYGCRNQIELKGMTRALIEGNYINGQWACSNSGNAILTFNAVDVTIQSNYITNAAAGFGLNGTGNSSSMVAYSSSANRILVNNNLLFNLGRSMFQAGGGGVGAPAIEMDSSPSNVTITNNTFGPIGNDNPITSPPTTGWFYPYILTDIGGGQLAGLTVQNNIFPFGLGQTPYGGGIGVQNGLAGAGNLSHPATPAPLGPSYSVAFTKWLQSIAGYADGAPGLGITGTSTIAGGSGYANGNLTFGSGCSAASGTYTVNGGAVQYSNLTDFGTCTPASGFTASAGSGGASLRPHYGLTYNYKWGGNVNFCTAYRGIDMDQGTCTWTSATMPSGDTWVPGENTAARLAASGVTANWAIAPTTSNAGNAGANLNAIWSAAGIVNNVSVAVSALSVRVSYTAPDSRACSVDTSLDGISWTRTSDGGGLPQRSIPVTGLRASTVYNYRLLCYFAQLTPLFAGSQITDGQFTTLAATTRNPAFAFNLGSFNGSTSFKVTMTAPDGVSQFSNVCTTKPCVVPGVPVGDYSTVTQWLAGANVIAASDAQVVSVR